MGTDGSFHLLASPGGKGSPSPTKAARAFVAAPPPPPPPLPPPRATPGVPCCPFRGLGALTKLNCGPSGEAVAAPAAVDVCSWCDAAHFSSESGAGTGSCCAEAPRREADDDEREMAIPVKAKATTTHAAMGRSPLCRRRGIPRRLGGTPIVALRRGQGRLLSPSAADCDYTARSQCCAKAKKKKKKHLAAFFLIELKMKRSKRAAGREKEKTLSPLSQATKASKKKTEGASSRSRASLSKRMTLPHLPAPLSRTQVFAELAHAGWSFTEGSRADKSGRNGEGIGEHCRPPPPASTTSNSSSSSFVVRAPPRGPRASAPSAFPFGRDDGRRLAASWLPSSSYRRPAGPEAATEALASAAGAVAAARLAATALQGDARWCRAAAEDLGRVAGLVRAAASSEASGAWIKCFERQHGRGEEEVGGGKSTKKKKKNKKAAAAAAAAARSASRALLDVSTAMAAAAKAVKRACAAPRAPAAAARKSGEEEGEEEDDEGGGGRKGPTVPLRFRLSAASVLDCVVALDAAFFALWEHFVSFSSQWDCPGTPAPHVYFPFIASKSPSASAAWRRLVSGPGRAAAPAWARAWGLEFEGEKAGGGGEEEEEAAEEAAAAEALAAAVEETLSSSSSSSTSLSSSLSSSTSNTHPLLRLIHARAAEGASLLWASGLVGAAGGSGGGGLGGAAAAASAPKAAAAAAVEKRRKMKETKKKRKALPSPQSSCTSSDSEAISSSSSDSDSGSSDSEGESKSTSGYGSDDDDDDSDADADDGGENAAFALNSAFGASSSLLLPDPNATQPWPASAPLAAWRASARECHSYAYAVPTRGAVRRMLSFSSASSSTSSSASSSSESSLTSPSWVEVGAGVGFWAAAMREELSLSGAGSSSARVLAVDVAAQRRRKYGGGESGGGGSRNQWHGRVPPVTEVELGGPEVLIPSSSSSSASDPSAAPSLLLCYPPPDGAMACASLAAVTPAEGGGGGGERGGGDRARSSPSAVVAVVGEVAGDTGGRSFWRELSSCSSPSSSSSAPGWRCVLRERLPDWSDTAAELLVFRFSKGEEREKEQERERSRPLVSCSCCGSAPATRRCRHCRSHALCEECSSSSGGPAADEKRRGAASCRRRHAAEHALRLLPAPEALDPSSSLWEALPAFLWKKRSAEEGAGKGSKKEKKKRERKRERKKS